MATEHYNLPTINGADPVSLVDTINGLANAADVALYAVDQHSAGLESAVETATGTANSASAAASAASTNATAAQQAAAAAQQTAQAASQTAAAAQQTAQAVGTDLDAFKQVFTLDDVTTVSSGLGISGATDYYFTLAKNSDGSIFKLYGNVYDATTGGSAVTGTMVAVPGLSGVTGIASGLYVGQPDAAYQVAAAGNIVHWTSSVIVNYLFLNFAVGSDGQIYLFTGMTGNTIIPANNGGRGMYNPNLYFNRKLDK